MYWLFFAFARKKVEIWIQFRYFFPLKLRDQKSVKQKEGKNGEQFSLLNEIESPCISFYELNFSSQLPACFTNTQESEKIWGEIYRRWEKNRKMRKFIHRWFGFSLLNMFLLYCAIEAMCRNMKSLSFCLHTLSKLPLPPPSFSQLQHFLNVEHIKFFQHFYEKFHKNFTFFLQIFVKYLKYF